jgi:hypothetical protein
MSKGLLLCYRHALGRSNFEAMGRLLSERLIPDNIQPNPPTVVTSKQLVMTVLNPLDTVKTHRTSACLGHFLGVASEWWRPLAPAPDGCFALFRSDDRHVELLTDATASRTIWYAQTDDVFVASTTQRAIILFLQSYSPNPAAHAWMLSDGTLGPGQAWDSRLKCVPANGRVILDRSTWRAREISNPHSISPERLSAKHHEENLRQAIRDVFGHLNLDFHRWALTLSGGYDSRCILEMLKHHKALQCVTCGLAASMENPESDAWVARELARHYGFRHAYVHTDLRADSIAEMFNRYLIAGEGRTDHVCAYLDCFDAWKSLFESGAVGVIRGDINFVPAVHSIAEIHTVTGANLLTDHTRLQHLQYFWPDQARPESMDRRPDETISAWRDRLGYEYHAPTVWGALNELKCGYVDVFNPFLTAGFIAAACRLPNTLRDGKRLFMKIVRESCADIPYATRPAIESLSSALSHPAVVSHMREELDRGDALDILPSEVVWECLGELVVQHTGSTATKSRPRVVNRAKTLIPKHIRERVHKALRPSTLHPNVIVFRLYIIARMHRMLKEDAQALRSAVNGLQLCQHAS